MRFMSIPCFALSRKWSISVKSSWQVSLIGIEHRWVANCWSSRRRLRKWWTPGTTKVRCPSSPIVDLSSLAVVIPWTSRVLIIVIQAINVFLGREIRRCLNWNPNPGWSSSWWSQPLPLACPLYPCFFGGLVLLGDSAKRLHWWQGGRQLVLKKHGWSWGYWRWGWWCCLGRYCTSHGGW